MWTWLYQHLVCTDFIFPVAGVQSNVILTGSSLKDQVTRWQDLALWWQRFYLVLKLGKCSQDRFPAGWCWLPAGTTGAGSALGGHQRFWRGRNLPFLMDTTDLAGLASGLGNWGLFIFFLLPYVVGGQKKEKGLMYAGGDRAKVKML